MRDPSEIEHNGRTVIEILDDEQPNLRYADLRNANLQDADLQDADLRYADLRYADLQDADLRYADLQSTELQDADLRYADLRNANLRYANLRYADLRNANLQDADLRYADLRYADLRYANLQDANLQSTELPNYQILPQEGSFIAYKGCQNHIVKLKIPKGAERTSSLKGRKCHASKAHVVEVFDKNGEPTEDTEAISCYDNGFYYREGKIVEPDEYDDDIRVACSHGIHFFITKEEAIDWL